MKFLMSIVAMATATLGASLREISNFGSNPSNIQMFIYTPDQLAPNPPIVVAMHYCGGSASSMFSYTALPSYSDRYGFILIYPQTTHDENCWDVYSSASLTRNGGGDSEGIVNMVKYALSTFNGDASRVFMMGSSSGAMMTNVLAGVYPDVFQAGAAFSGVPCGCMFGDNGGNPTSSNQTCAQGGINWAAQRWADFAINCDPGYSGSRPRLQMWHGTADGLVNYKVLSQELEQWSTVLGASFSHNVSGYPLSYYTKMVYGDGTKLQGYSGTGVQHPAPVQESPMLSFFGLLGGAATSTTPVPTTTPTTTPAGGGAGPTQTEWGQCGGIGWMGPTACANTLTCTTQNPYYAQCIPTAH